MNQVKAIVSSLVKNPGLVKSLIEDPQGFARSAGLGEAELKALNGVGNAVSGILNRVSATLAPVAAAGTNPPASASLGTNATGQTGNDRTGVLGIMSLVAVVGAVVVLSTVSTVALNGRSEDRPH